MAKKYLSCRGILSTKEDISGSNNLMFWYDKNLAKFQILIKYIRFEKVLD